jgi:hypothetical protein
LRGRRRIIFDFGFGISDLTGCGMAEDRNGDQLPFYSKRNSGKPNLIKGSWGDLNCGFRIWDLKGRPMTGDGIPMYDDLKPNTPTPKESNLE